MWKDRKDRKNKALLKRTKLYNSILKKRNSKVLLNEESNKQKNEEKTSLTSSDKNAGSVEKDNIFYKDPIRNEEAEANALGDSQYTAPVTSPDDAVSPSEQRIKDIDRVLSMLEERLNDEFICASNELFLLNRDDKVSENNEELKVDQRDDNQLVNSEEEEKDILPPKNETAVEGENDNALIKLDLDSLEKELKRERDKRRFIKLVISTFNGLVVTAAIAILVAMLWMPVLQIYGSSMTPTLSEGDIVVAIKDNNFKTGDLVAFYYGNKLLVKRCIAGPADWVEIDEEGNVKVNGNKLEEPYVSEKSLGECDLEFPYQVPEEQWFLVGDHRKTSVDSRSNTIGMVSSEQIVGKVILRVWPLNELSWL